MMTTERRLKSVQYTASPASIVPEYQAEWFAGHDRIVAPIRRHLTMFPEQCQTLIDIGTGDGAVLDDIASRLPQFKKLIGISADQRGLNLAQARTHHDARLSFHQANPWAWLRQGKPAHAITFSYDNLSMLPESSLEDWFVELRDSGATGIALIEPRRGGCAYLPTLLQHCGWTIRYSESPYQSGQAWWHVFASFQHRANPPEAIQ